VITLRCNHSKIDSETKSCCGISAVYF